MSELKNKPLTKFLDLFVWEKLSETTRKQVLMLFFSFGGYLGTFIWTRKDTQRSASGWDAWLDF
jgi:hypothetical protein